MNNVITVLILVICFFGCREIYGYYQKAQKESDGPSSRTVEKNTPSLPDLPTPQLEQSLATATAGGAETFRKWIDSYGHLAPEPRRSAIELDYVQLASRTHPGDAKRVFGIVKAKTRPDSPIYERVKKMEKSFQ